ncbi:MAG TPA: hypothetical protein VKA59_05100 [Vicinamibacterales bacterium]|nr:hypothetical protein [Vicinamibacterales bacterium]
MSTVASPPIRASRSNRVDRIADEMPSSCESSSAHAARIRSRSGTFWAKTRPPGRDFERHGFDGLLCERDERQAHREVGDGDEAGHI